jgi:hypothetical protein
MVSPTHATGPFRLSNRDRDWLQTAVFELSAAGAGH